MLLERFVLEELVRPEVEFENGLILFKDIPFNVGQVEEGLLVTILDGSIALLTAS